MDGGEGVAYIDVVRAFAPSVLAAGALLVVAPACLVEIKDLRTADGGGGTAGAGGTGTGTGAMGGADTSSGTGGAAGPCPEDMVHATHPDLPDVSFCIDRTEVTQADYTLFLVGVGDVAGAEQPTECADNASLTRTDAGSNCPNWSAGDQRAVNCVDWCDAYAYCAWAGKRLCGDLEGGPLALGDPVTNDEWQFACSGGFQTTYPYGNTAEVCACYIPEEWETKMMCDLPSGTNYNQKAEVASHPDCEGGFPGIFDMQGNVAEWTNRCEPPDGMGTEHCSVRGGSTWSGNGSSYYTCDNLAQSEERLQPALETGIRCCKDAL